MIDLNIALCPQMKYKKDHTRSPSLFRHPNPRWGVVCGWCTATFEEADGVLKFGGYLKKKGK